MDCVCSHTIASSADSNSVCVLLWYNFSSIRSTSFSFFEAQICSMLVISVFFSIYLYLPVFPIRLYKIPI